MTTETTEAIARSIRQTEIVTLPWTPERAAALDAVAEDSADTDEVCEYWGTRDGDEWRVHLRRAAAGQD